MILLKVVAALAVLWLWGHILIGDDWRDKLVRSGTTRRKK
jgi:hypothetical protein